MKVLWVQIFLLLCLSCGAQERVMFWNLENFFDYRNDSTSVSDAEFSSRGARHWTKKRFRAKCDAVAKGILWAAAEEGTLPDIIGVAEIENGRALRRLLGDTVLEKLDYRTVHFNSPDPRGIDVGLLYRRSSLQLLDAKPCHVYAPDSSVMATRDILLAHFIGPGGDLAVLVNHHPSKFSGAASAGRRERAVARLVDIVDSLKRAGVERIVAIGDFNDTPENPLYSDIPLSNLALPLHRRGIGTIKYDGRWELIDLAFVSDNIAGTEMKVLHIPFLETQDASGGGTKPLRTYVGPRYAAGVSDHCPIWLTLTE